MKFETNTAKKRWDRLAKVAMVGSFTLALSGCFIDDFMDDSSSGGGSTTATKTTTTPKPAATPAPKPAPTTPTTTAVKTGSPTSSPSTANAPRAACSNFPGGGMVWKPTSEGDGKLVVLLQPGVPNVGASVADATGNIVASGRYSGHTNGNRATYRFAAPGRSYPAPAILITGGAKICIPNPASRYG